MKLPAIKKAVESYTIAELNAAEQALMEERTPEIAIEGDDEGEQLTHVLAAVFIKEKMETEGLDYLTALRQYTLRVRTSIS